MDECRATIQSLLSFTEAGGSQRVSPPWPSQATVMARVAGQRKGPPSWCSPRNGHHHELDSIKNLMTSRWPLLTLERVQIDGKPRRKGGGKTRALSLSNAATTTAGPMGATILVSTSLRSIPAGAYLSRLGALPLLVSCGKSAGRPFPRSSQRYLRSMMGG